MVLAMWEVVSWSGPGIGLGGVVVDERSETARGVECEEGQDPSSYRHTRLQASAIWAPLSST